MIDAESFAGIALFGDLNAEAVALLRSRGAIRRYAPGALLWRRGEEPGGLFVVVEGEVRVVRDTEGDGRRRVIHTETAGGTLGEVPLFEGTRYPATAIASRRTTCHVFDRVVIIDAMRADPTLGLALLRRMASRVRHLIDRLDGMVARPVPVRLAAWIDRRAADAAPFTLGGTQQELAEELGTVREVIVRELRTLREAGIIASVGRGRFRVTDRSALRALARE